jgi:two-component system sensor histidine kinase AlgZ
LPDFRNLGVMSRILLAANGLALLGALARSQQIADFATKFTAIAGWLEPVLLVILVILYVLSGVLARLPYQLGLVSVLLIALVVTGALFPVQMRMTAESGGSDLYWNLAYAGLGTALLAWYFHLRTRAFSPALAEARLQALQARIRPHFLFNSLTAVLSLIRHDPKRAETAIEDLAELFRAVIGETRRLAALGDEIALCRQYLNLEQLRLGPRLRVEWRLDPSADRALVPPMLLQPLVENAVYHGIEPGVEPGTIEIVTEREGERLRISLSNPYQEEHQHRQGNRMALANIQERLRLHFDVEARLETGMRGERYHIDIRMPFRSAV